MKTEEQIKQKIGEIYANRSTIDLNYEQKPSLLMMDMLKWVLLSNEN